MINMTVRTKRNIKLSILLLAIILLTYSVIGLIGLSNVLAFFGLHTTDTIYFWIDCGNNTEFEEYVKRVVDTYNEHNDEKISVRTSFNDYIASVTYAYRYNGTPTAKNKIPDINITYGEYMQDILSMGDLLQLSEASLEDGNTLNAWFKEEYLTLFQNFNRESINMINGKVYAYPFFCDTYRMVYNTEIFTYAGESIIAPTTFSDLKNVCDSINLYSARNNLDIAPIALPVKEADKWMYTLEQIGKTSDIYSLNSSNARSTYSNLVPIASLFVPGGSMWNNMRMTEEELIDAFLDGHIGVIFTDSVTFENRIADRRNNGKEFSADGKWMSAAIPVYDFNGNRENVGTAFADVSYIHINGNTKYKEQCVAFVEYLLGNDDIMSGFMDYLRGIPSTWEHICNIGTDREDMYAALKSIEKTSAWQGFYTFGEDKVWSYARNGSVASGDSFAVMLNKVIDKQITIENVLKELDRRYNEED